MKRGAHKILVIDDDKTVVGTLTAVLRAAGYQVVSALDPVQGLPAGGGMQLLEKLTSTGKAPVVVITMMNDPKTDAEAQAAGAAAFLPKPVDPGALKDVIESLLPT